MRNCISAPCWEDHDIIGRWNHSDERIKGLSIGPSCNRLYYLTQHRAKYEFSSTANCCQDQGNAWSPTRNRSRASSFLKTITYIRKQLVQSKQKVELLTRIIDVDND